MSVRPDPLIPEPNPEECFFNWVDARSYNWFAALEHVYGRPEFGRNRVTFRAGDWVIKLPRSSYGIDDNASEARQSGNESRAFCYLLHDVDGFPLLIMERVIMTPMRLLPKWSDSIDCQQVGLSRRTGTFVAYDFA